MSDPKISHNRIGIRRGGKRLSGSQLRAHVDRLKELYRYFSDQGVRLRISANTILSPFDDKEDFEEKIGVLSDLREEGITANYTILTPFPATPLARKYKGQYVPASETLSTHGWQNCWSTDLPGSHTLDYLSIITAGFALKSAPNDIHYSSEFWTAFFRKMSLQLGFNDFGDGSELREFVDREYDFSTYEDLEVQTPYEVIDIIVSEGLTDNSEASKVRIAEVIFGESYSEIIKFNLRRRDTYLAKHSETD